MLLAELARPVYDTSQPEGVSEMHIPNTILSPAANIRGSRTILVVSGPAGCGKTTVASHLANELNIPFLEGDEFHSPANKSKMSRGLPLADEDRWDWLRTIREAALTQFNHADAVVVSCSALKRRYRDVLRGGPSPCREIQVRFFQLRVSKSALEARVGARAGHYMKKDMVESQLLALEEAADDEGDLFTVDAQQSVKSVCEDVRMLALAVMGCRDYV